METPREKDGREQQKLSAVVELKEFNILTPYQLRTFRRFLTRNIITYNMKYN